MSEDPILHICSFLDGGDLLKLSEVDTTMHRIITKSKKTMDKIRLVLDPDSDGFVYDDVMKLAGKRTFTALKMVNFAELAPTLALLRDSVEDLIIEESEFEEDYFRSLIQNLLPYLKKCSVNNVSIIHEDSQDLNKGFSLGEFDSINRPMETLQFIGTSGNVLQFFECCTQLKTFECHGPDYDDADIEAVNDFLADQPCLKKLIHHCTGLAWDRLTCFQLQELDAACEDDVAAADFLEKLLNLQKLSVTVFHYLPRRLMQAICKSPKLESLNISTHCSHGDEYDEPLDGLENVTIKKLVIDDGIGVAGQLLQLFLGVESITVDLSSAELDLSEVPSETIKKIEHIYSSERIHIKVSPIVVPEEVYEFESAVLTIVKKFSHIIRIVTIGNETWREHSSFRLTNKFAERLVKRLPKLFKLTLYNIADRHQLISFLDVNRKSFRLKVVKLPPQKEANEPEPKKITFEL